MKACRRDEQADWAEQFIPCLKVNERVDFLGHSVQREKEFNFSQPALAYEDTSMLEFTIHAGANMDCRCNTPLAQGPTLGTVTQRAHDQCIESSGTTHSQVSSKGAWRQLISRIWDTGVIKCAASCHCTCTCAHLKAKTWEDMEIRHQTVLPIGCYEPPLDATWQTLRAASAKSSADGPERVHRQMNTARLASFPWSYVQECPPAASFMGGTLPQIASSCRFTAGTTGGCPGVALEPDS